MDLVLQMAVNGLVAGSAHGLLALSFSLIYCTARFFHLAHAAVYTVGAYAALVATTSFGVPAPIAVVIGTFAAVGVGLGVDTAIYRPLRKRKGSPLVFLLASIGALVVLQNCVSLLFGDAVLTMPGQTTQGGHKILSARITSVQLTSLSVSLGAYTGMHVALKRTWWGMRIRAVIENKSLADAVGIKSHSVMLVSFAIGSALAGVAASIAAYDTGLRPMMGFNALLLSVVAMVVGGVGNVSAAYLGGLMVGMVQQVSALLLPTKWQDAVVFILLVGFLLARPHGFFGSRIPKAAI